MSRKAFGLTVVGLAILAMAASASASGITYVGTDTTTGGNWQGVYGASGYTIFGGPTSLPAGVTVATPWAWGVYAVPGNPDDQLALQNPAGGRIISCVYAAPVYGLTLELGDTPTQVAMYLYFGVVDGMPRGLTVDMLEMPYPTSPEGYTAAPALDTRSMIDGQWLVYEGTGTVHFRLTGAASGQGWANLGAVMISPVPEPATMSLLAVGGMALIRRWK